MSANEIAAKVQELRELRRMADENRILRTGQADIEQAPLFRERVRIDSAAGVAVKQRIRAGEGQDALF